MELFFCNHKLMYAYSSGQTLVPIFLFEAPNIKDGHIQMTLSY